MLKPATQEDRQIIGETIGEVIHHLGGLPNSTLAKMMVVAVETAAIKASRNQTVDVASIIKMAIDTVCEENFG